MSNKLTNAYALAGSPVRLSGLAQSIHALLLHRFDDRPILNGKPNKGYRKSYPSMEEIQTWCTGFSRQAISKAIEELITNGFIIRVEIGRPGQRANYVPVYALALIGDYVNVSLHKSKNYKGKKVAVSDSPDSTMSKQSLHNVLGQAYTISNISNTSNNRNKDRFTVFIDSLPIALKCLDPGPNLDALLDVLEAKGGTLKALADHLNDHDYTGAESLNKVLFKRLRTFIETLPDRKTNEEHNRELQSQLEEMQRNKATPEQLAERVAQARKALGRE
ncbi:MAG: hypothetical protein F2720_00515 [Actinobacteria bacterium]|uniref:Unannotated protein n=1 Tax=freshwater metagenome TaxID=449393 RepID=A0A6J6V6U0_9ZZZZ|nr:hypothetical protein [Actinomycetota bacterium]